MPIGENIRKLRNQLGMTQDELGAKIGMSGKAVSTWENERREPKMGSIEAMARIFGVTKSEIIDGDIPESRPQFFPAGRIACFPIMCTVKAGYSGLSVEDYSGDYEQIPADMLNGYAPETCRVMRVRGNSMHPKILEGDKILIHLQEDIVSGDIAVVLIGQEEATLKRVVKRKDSIELIAANPEYESKIFRGMALSDLRIYGKVIKLIRDF